MEKKDRKSPVLGASSTSASAGMEPCGWTDSETLQYATKMLNSTPWGRRTITLLEDLKADSDSLAGAEHENKILRNQNSALVLASLKKPQQINGVDVAGVVCSTCGLVANFLDELGCGGQH